MKATPQQVQGGSLYSHKTRLGNWAEEIAINEAKLNNFRQRSEAGSLALRKQEVKLERCNEIVPHSFSEDGLVRFGDSVVVQHSETGVLLACDPFEAVVQNQEMFLVTGAVQPIQPKARNTYRIVQPPERLQDRVFDLSDPVLKIGQPFCLAASDSLLVNQTNILNPQLYLCSMKKNERVGTRTTNRQLVYMAPVNDADSVWITTVPSMGHKNASERYLAIGGPVMACDTLQLTHRQTNMNLCVDPKNAIQSEFGVDYECYADRTALTGKVGLMMSEMSGQSTPSTLAKPDNPVYGWNLVLASDPNMAQDTRSLPQAASEATILSELQYQVSSKGVDGYWSLRAYFLALEKKALNVGKIDREDLKDALRRWGVTLEDKFLDPIINLQDTTKLGLLDWRAFVEYIRGGALSGERRNVATEVFMKMAKGDRPEVTADDLAFYFDGKSSPLVTIAGLSAQEALAHMFMAISKGGVMPSVVKLDQFLDYYADLSAGTNDDGYFEAVLRGSWPVEETSQ
jgi:hypothetical protein